MTHFVLYEEDIHIYTRDLTFENICGIGNEFLKTSLNGFKSDSEEKYRTRFLELELQHSILNKDTFAFVVYLSYFNDDNFYLIVCISYMLIIVKKLYTYSFPQ